MKMRFILCFLSIIAGLVLFLPEPALAWGPGVHMVMGNWILQNLAVLPPCVADPLLRYPGLFLHGCLSADIFIGKGSVTKKGHSHNWESGFALLERARSPRFKSYAYGYLSHLAADTVAHNVFVPGLLPIAPGNGKMAHIYIEMQADRLLPWDRKDALAVFHERGSKNASNLLRKTLRRNAVKFRLQSGVFQGSIAIGGSALWRRSLKAVEKVFPERIRLSWLETMLKTATRAAVDVLRHGAASPVVSLDPIGAQALAQAVAARSGRGFFPARREERIILPELPEPLLTLPAVCAADDKAAS